MDERASVLLCNALDRLGLPTSDHVKILRIARTIADLDLDDTIRAPHVAEALTLVARHDAPIFGATSA